MTTDGRRKRNAHKKPGVAYNSGGIRRVARCGMLTALAMIFSYLEALIPVSLGIPGVKLGLANLVTMVAVYELPVADVCLISAVRIVVSGVLFSNATVILYSLAGAACSIFVMLLMKKTGRFSKVSVSVAGGVAHNLGQLAVAFVVIEHKSILYYAPVLVLSGVVAGSMIGVLASIVLKRRQDVF